ncbi:MAG: ABC transporter ATP-binding protein [Candidatus Nanopelagicales bacterium]
MITLDRVGKTYPDGTTAVADLSLHFTAGEVGVLVGPSGCGKTTTMRMINRLVEPTHGQVYVDGRDVSQVNAVDLRRSIGYVIQQVGLLPHQTIRRNVGTVPTLSGWDSRRVRQRVDELLDMVGLPPDTYGDRYPDQLSGGQRQRVGVARALAADPPILLMDEPFGAVDPVERGRLQSEMLSLLAREEKTVVLVTHDVDEAVRLGDRIAVMRQGGVLEQFATPVEILGDPKTPFVADFVGTDRTIKLLGVTTIGELALEPVAADDRGISEVSPDATLKDVLAQILRSESGRVRVGDQGIATMESVRHSLRQFASVS